MRTRVSHYNFIFYGRTIETSGGAGVIYCDMYPSKLKKRKGRKEKTSKNTRRRRRASSFKEFLSSRSELYGI